MAPVGAHTPAQAKNVPPPHLSYYLDLHQGLQTRRSQHHKYVEHLQSIWNPPKNRQKYWKIHSVAVFRRIWEEIPGSAPKFNGVFCGPWPIPPKGLVQIKALLFCIVLSSTDQQTNTELDENLLGRGRRYCSHFYIKVTTAIRPQETDLTHLNWMPSDKSWGCSR